MKTRLLFSLSPLLLVSLLPSCTVDWKRAGIAATNAAAPIVLEGLNAKAPKDVQP